MSGTVCGLLECRTAGVSYPDKSQEPFKNLYEFCQRMVAVGNAERIALQYGNGGTGTDYWDGANPFGENAFAVYKWLASASTERTIDIYILIQWADADSFGNSPGNPGKCKGTTSIDGFGIAFAWRDDGTNPWAGTTNNDGTDTKGSVVWTDGSSTCRMMDRSCSTGGSNSTNKENCLFFNCYRNSTYSRTQYIGDADGIIVLTDAGDSGTPYCHYFGIYEPRDGLTPSACFIGVNGTIIPWGSSTFGTTSGTGGYEGGVLGNFNADNVRGFKALYNDNYVFMADYQPNSQIDPVEFDAFPWLIFHEEVHKGLLGQLPVDMIGLVSYVPQNTTNPAATKAYFGGTTMAAIKIAVPWDGGAQPYVNTTREGRTF